MAYEKDTYGKDGHCVYCGTKNIFQVYNEVDDRVYIKDPSGDGACELWIVDGNGEAKSAYIHCPDELLKDITKALHLIIDRKENNEFEKEWAKKNKTDG